MGYDKRRGGRVGHDKRRGGRVGYDKRRGGRMGVEGRGDKRRQYGQQDIRVFRNISVSEKMHKRKLINS